MAEKLYEAIGGAEGCHKLATAFYTGIKSDPVLRPFFPGKTQKCAIEAFAAFLVQFLGGPAEHSQRRWYLSLRESHARFGIGESHRQAWLRKMAEALERAEIAEPARTALRQFFEESSAYLVKRDQSKIADPELAERWRIQQDVDAAVAAIRIGDTEGAKNIAESLTNPSVLVGLLAVMIGSRNPKLLQFVGNRITHNPSLARERYAGRTLLHEAAAKGARTIVELLLKLGADPNVQDGGKHTPLYSVSNECGFPGGGRIVRLLVNGGALVNAANGVKHCTPLHMAARRGNTEIAEALLACGADPEARDTQGDTPLRRALNCRKREVAALLLTAGATRRVG